MDFNECETADSKKSLSLTISSLVDLILIRKCIKKLNNNINTTDPSHLMNRFSGTYIVHHVPLGVGTGPVKHNQQRLQVLCGVVLCMQQQHRQKPRRLDPGWHQPVGHIVGDSWYQSAQVSNHQFSAAQPRTFHWKETTTVTYNNWKNTFR